MGSEHAARIPVLMDPKDRAGERARGKSERSAIAAPL